MSRLKNEIERRLNVDVLYSHVLRDLDLELHCRHMQNALSPLTWYNIVGATASVPAV